MNIIVSEVNLRSLLGIIGNYDIIYGQWLIMEKKHDLEFKLLTTLNFYFSYKIIGIYYT